MPLYDYQCEQCQYDTEVEHRMFDDGVRQCPHCGQMSLRKVTINPPTAFVRGEPTTIGGLADQNARKMGHYELQEKSAQDNNRPKLTPEQKAKRDTHQKIVSMTPEQKMKWIQNGD